MLRVAETDALRILEVGYAQHPIDRALTILACVWPDLSREALADLPLGERDLHLLRIREHTFGPVMRGFSECTSCREKLEYELQIAEVLAQVTPDLGEYDWPGNVREMRNLIERSLIVGALNVSALYQSLSRAQAGKAPPADVTTDLATLEKQHILRVLESVDGDKSRAAELLGISRRTLERRCAERLQA